MYEEVAPGLLSLALHLTKDAEQAEDLVQEVFLQAYQGQGQWDPDAPVDSWMGHMLAQSFERMRSEGESTQDMVALGEGEEFPAPNSPLSDVQLAELRDRLEQAIDGLPEHYRSVVRLIIQEGKSSDEAGQILQRPSGTVRSQLARALDRLRQVLPGAMALAIWSKTQTPAEGQPASPLERIQRRILDRTGVASTSKPSPSQGPGSKRFLWAGAAALVAAALWTGFHRPGVRDQVDAANLEAEHTETIETSTELVAANSDPVRQEPMIPMLDLRPVDGGPVIRGKVTDSDGHPISDVKVTIYYWEPWIPKPEDADSNPIAQEEWRAKVEDSRLESEGGYGYFDMTDGQGRYAIQVPCMPPGEPTLLFAAGKDYTQITARFSSSVSHLAPLSEGLNSIPTVQLEPAGSIEGVLLAHDGTPADTSFVSITPGTHNLPDYWVSTDLEGAFRVDHLPAGVHNLRMIFRGRVLQDAVTVTAGATTTLPDVIFSGNQHVRIQVVDEAGVGLEGAKVVCEPLNSGLLATYPSAKSDASGSLEIDVPEGGQHAIQLDLRGYDAEQDLYRLEPGQTELLIRARAAKAIRIRVTDENTGKPLTHASARTQKWVDGIWEDCRRISHLYLGEDGTQSIAYVEGARAKIYHRHYKAFYLPMDRNTPDFVEVRLSTLHPATGQLVLNGAPVPGVDIEIAPVDIKGKLDAQPKDILATARFGPYEPTWCRSDAEGRFEFDPVNDPEIWYVLRASDKNQHSVLHTFQLKGAGPHSLGSLDLQATGTLSGSLILPDCVRPLGLKVLPDLGFGGRFAQVAADGSFAIDNLTPGQHFLHLESTPGLAPLPSAIPFHIVAGQTTQLEVDLRPYELTRRHIHLIQDGHPMAYHKVYLRTGEASTDFEDKELLGVTDAEGSVAGDVIAGGFASLWVQGPGDPAPYRHPTATVPLHCETIPLIEITF
ncbi:MAG: sigma-70 family RNA polymerase sigma factor [Planctomycetes bacterium]|nr:sigma-70 family RNA polymerase sigma factor [Planctomycetota bacterium]